MTKQASGKLKAQVTRYKLLKRVAKRLKDKLEVLNTSIMEQCGDAPCIILSGDEKLASIIDKPRTGLDTVKLREEMPDVAAKYATSSSSLVLLMH